MPLLALPTEILLMVMKLITWRDITVLCKTGRCLAGVATDFLYRSVTIDLTSPAAIFKFGRCLTKEKSAHHFAKNTKHIMVLEHDIPRFTLDRLASMCMSSADPNDLSEIATDLIIASIITSIAPNQLITFSFNSKRRLSSQVRTLFKNQKGLQKYKGIDDWCHLPLENLRSLDITFTKKKHLCLFLKCTSGLIAAKNITQLRLSVIGADKFEDAFNESHCLTNLPSLRDLALEGFSLPRLVQPLQTITNGFSLHALTLWYCRQTDLFLSQIVRQYVCSFAYLAVSFPIEPHRFGDTLNQLSTRSQLQDLHLLVIGVNSPTQMAFSFPETMRAFSYHSFEYRSLFSMRCLQNCRNLERLGVQVENEWLKPNPGAFNYIARWSILEQFPNLTTLHFRNSADDMPSPDMLQKFTTWLFQELRKRKCGQKLKYILFGISTHRVKALRIGFSREYVNNGQAPVAVQLPRNQIRAMNDIDILKARRSEWGCVD